MATTAETAPAISAEEREFIASQWQLVWRRFLKHRLAVAATAIIIAFYLIAALCEFLAVHDPLAQNAQRSFVPPQRVHFFDGWKPAWPYVNGLLRERNPVTLKPEYSADESKRFSIRLFARGH